ncbi:MAG: hypothetical protein AAF479_13455 [Pseudomonadota bacterium]
MLRWILRKLLTRWGLLSLTILAAIGATGFVWFDAISTFLRVPSKPEPTIAFERVLGTSGTQDRLERRPNLALHLVWTAQGDQLISRQEDGTVVSWDVASGEERAIARTQAVFAYCPAESRLLVNIDNDAVLLGLADGQFRKVSEGRHDHAAFSADCSALAIAREDEAGIRLRRGDTWTRVETAQPVRNSLMISPKGGFLAASGGTWSEEIGHRTALEIFDLNRSERTVSLDNSDEILGLWSMAFSANGDGLMLGSQVFGQSGLRHIESKSGEVRWGHDGFGADWVRALAVSPDGILLATGDERGMLRVWEVDSGVMVSEFSTGRVIQSLAFSADGRRLALGLWDGTIGIVMADQLIGQ